MQTVPRFFLNKKCEWCNIINDHFVDFEMYLPKKDIILYRVTCEYCYDKARTIIDGTYNYTRYSCSSKYWDNMIPKNILNFN